MKSFLIGNKKSLVDAMEKGIDLRKQILKLYKNHYHGGLMKLVIIGGGKVPFFSFFYLLGSYPCFS